MTSSKYYTYAYLREDRTPYYVGKGSNGRAYGNHGRISVPKDKNRILILKENLTEQEAFKHEVYMIAILGRKDLGNGILRNRTNGGEGPSGAVRSEEWKQNKSKRMSGENHPLYGSKCPEHSARMSGKNNPMYGKKRPEHSERMSAKNHTEEQKRNLSEKNSGEKHPQAKKYILTDPQGVEYTVNGTLKLFCKQKGINYSAMQTAAHRKQTTPRPSNGWSIR